MHRINCAVLIGLLHVLQTLSTPQNLEFNRQGRYLRTELRFGRNLDPDKVEEINIKSNDGKLLKLLVKKRHRDDYNFNYANDHAPRNYYYTRHTNENINIPNYNSTTTISNAAAIVQKYRQSQIQSQIQNAIHNQRMDQLLRLPADVVVNSNPINGLPHYNVKTEFTQKTSKDAISGIPVIEGVRMHDTPEDKTKVWRNARVIKGELVPYPKGYTPKKAEPPKIDDTAIIRSRSFVTPPKAKVARALPDFGIYYF